MLRILSVLTLAAFASVADAGVIVSSSLNISNFTIKIFGTNTILTNGSEVLVSSLPSISASTAFPAGLGSATATASGGLINGLSFPNPPGPNIVLLQPVTSMTAASLNIPTAQPEGSFLSRGSVSTGTSFDAVQNVSVFAEFTGAGSLVASTDDGFPIGSVFASNAFSISLLGPSGLVGPVFTPTALNVVRTTFGTSTIISQTFATGAFVLTAGTTYTFSASQRSEARFNSVPEPTSFLAFAGLGLCGLMRRRYRSKATA